MKYPQSQAKTHTAVSTTATLLFGLPFDLARESYAVAVKWGLIKDSMLGSAQFARDVSKMEKLALGPWARQV